jgi:3-methyl-2-oxobutanoate hydroxymethyltransferase
MPRIFDFGGRDVERSQTIAGLRALKGSGRRAAQVTAETADEAAAVEAAGVEMVVCRADNVTRVREGSRRVFVTAALGFADAISCYEILRTAFGAVTAGADALITGRGYEVVRMLTDECIPVMGHLGFVPRKSTWVGAVRAVGKTSGRRWRFGISVDVWKTPAPSALNAS